LGATAGLPSSALPNVALLYPSDVNVHSDNKVPALWRTANKLAVAHKPPTNMQSELRNSSYTTSGQIML
jgi:hypothetical protein